MRLLTSPAYENQAFRWGEVAYGVQFHLEVDEKLGTEWKSVPGLRARRRPGARARAGSTA